MEQQQEVSPQPVTISSAVKRYLQSVNESRSENTTRTYQNGMQFFLDVLQTHQMDPEKTPLSNLSEDAISWMISGARYYSPSTERLYLTAVTGFYEFLLAENLAEFNMIRIRMLISQRARRPGIRLPQFPKYAIDQVLEFVDQLAGKQVESDVEKLRNLRDRAFLLTLADTGLRVHEACKLRRGDLDWREGRAVVIGKGNREDIVRFSTRAQKALKDYLQARSEIDGASGRQLASLPLFARHDPGAGSKIRAITTRTGQNIVHDRVVEAMGSDAAGVTITPHSFRHYFVTRILQSSGNLKLAQALARHQNIAVTQRYTHLSDNELDQGYWDAIEG